MLSSLPTFFKQTDGGGVEKLFIEIKFKAMIRYKLLFSPNPKNNKF